MKNIFAELIGFLRPEISVFLASTTAIGFFVFNEPSWSLVTVTLASFFLAAHTYSFNSMMDRKEDAINKGKLNAFASGKKGVIVSFALAAAGFALIYTLGTILLALYTILLLLNIFYSAFKVKRFFLAKNIYTSLLGAMFLMGAMAGGTVNAMMLLHSAAFSLLFLAGSIISDLRDFKGDAKIGFRTMPVVLGYGKTKKIALALLLAAAFSIFLLDARKLYIIALFTFPTAGLLQKNEVKKVHTLTGLSFLLTLLWLAIS